MKLSRIQLILGCYLAIGLAFGGCQVDPSNSFENSYDIVLLQPNRNSVTEVFQSNLLMVAPIKHVSENAGGDIEAMVDYPSLNHGGEDGRSTVMYSHSCTLVLEESVRSILAEEESVNRLWVLLIEDERAFTYRPIGYTTGSNTFSMDWFADKPELLYRLR